MNTLFLTGKLALDPELKLSTDGQSYFLHNSIAVWRPSSDKKNAVDYIPFVAFGKQAEFIKKCVKKNARINLIGRLQTSKYKDENGEERNGFEVVVDNVEFGIRGLTQET